MKILIISGSPRKGNTEYVLSSLFNSIKEEKSLVLLRNKTIKHCKGCGSCEETNECVLKDDMQEMYKELEGANTIIIGSPIYFSGITGLLKDFIDRTNLFYGTTRLSNKKLIAVGVGEQSKEMNKKIIDYFFEEFVRTFKMNFLGSFIFRANLPNDLKNNSETKQEINKILKLIQKDLFQ